jgi:N utilization substance protein A
MVANVTSHAITLNLGRTEAIMPRNQQVPGERYRIGQRIRAYVMEVRRTSRGPQIIVSRTHRHMLRRLLELEVPEIYNGTVEIKAIAREAGSRSKVAVAALQDGVDPVGSCVGIRGMRIQSIVSELGGEKIDVVEWSPDTSIFIGNALSPARVKQAILGDAGDGKTATVIVPDDQLSLAIGKEGQNARLAAKLTGWRIDIKSTSEAAYDAVSGKRALAETKPKDRERDILAMAEAILLGKAPPEPEEAEGAPAAPEAVAEPGPAEAEQDQEALLETAQPAVDQDRDATILMEAQTILAQEEATQETPEEEMEAQEPVPAMEASAPVEPAMAELASTEEAQPEAALAEEAAIEVEPPVGETAEPEPQVAEAEPEADEEEEPLAEPQPLGVIKRAPKPKRKTWRRPQYQYVRDEQLEALDEPKKTTHRRRRRQLVLDEETGQVISQHMHKREDDEEEWSDEEF